MTCSLPDSTWTQHDCGAIWNWTSSSWLILNKERNWSSFGTKWDSKSRKPKIFNDAISLGGGRKKKSSPSAGLYVASDFFFFWFFFPHVKKMKKYSFSVLFTETVQHTGPICISISNGLSFLTIWLRSLLCKWFLGSGTIWIMWPSNKKSAKLAAIAAHVLPTHLHMLRRNSLRATLKIYAFAVKHVLGTSAPGCSEEPRQPLVHVERNVTGTSSGFHEP